MHTPTVAKALDAYADAVAKRARQESHGRHGDGMLEARQHDEKMARAAVFQAIRQKH